MYDDPKEDMPTMEQVEWLDDFDLRRAYSICMGPRSVSANMRIVKHSGGAGANLAVRNVPAENETEDSR